MASYTARTVTLLRRPLGEADHLVVFLSKDTGKIRAVARGTRKPKSKLAAVAQPFVEADVMFGKGRGGLDVVAQVQVVESFRSLREDLRRFAHASYWAELIDRGVEQSQPAPRVYSLLLACLKLGAQANEPLLAATAYFQLHLMRVLGFEMALVECPECGAPLQAGKAHWVSAVGGGVCSDCIARVLERRPLTDDVLDLLRRLATVRSTRLFPLAAAPSVLNEAEALIRDYVSYHMDVELKSLSLLREVDRLA